MSEQLHEIITNSSIRSFNQGYNMGRDEERTRITKLMEDRFGSITSQVIIKIIKGETK